MRAYSEGGTPNPDLACNRNIKFGELLAAARCLGAEAVATGACVCVCVCFCVGAEAIATGACVFACHFINARMEVPLYCLCHFHSKAEQM